MDHDLRSILTCINFDDDIESVNNTINEYIAQNMDGSLARLLEDPWEKHVFWKTIEWMLYDPRGDPDDDQDKFWIRTENCFFFGKIYFHEVTSKNFLKNSLHDLFDETDAIESPNEQTVLDANKDSIDEENDNFSCSEEWKGVLDLSSWFKKVSNIFM